MGLVERRGRSKIIHVVDGYAWAAARGWGAGVARGRGDELGGARAQGVAGGFLLLLGERGVQVGGFLGFSLEGGAVLFELLHRGGIRVVQIEGLLLQLFETVLGGGVLLLFVLKRLSEVLLHELSLVRDILQFRLLDFERLLGELFVLLVFRGFCERFFTLASGVGGGLFAQRTRLFFFHAFVLGRVGFISRVLLSSLGHVTLALPLNALVLRRLQFVVQSVDLCLESVNGVVLFQRLAFVLLCLLVCSFNLGFSILDFALQAIDDLLEFFHFFAVRVVGNLQFFVQILVQLAGAVKLALHQDQLLSELLRV
mmetsp:Transcript_504/g.2053  ORF Transcript_504/g.2053 Transcript_504/m.2053 type:complete len:312 (+) Transcript_504:47-982(+)